MYSLCNTYIVCLIWRDAPLLISIFVLTYTFFIARKTVKSAFVNLYENFQTAFIIMHIERRFQFQVYSLKNLLMHKVYHFYLFINTLLHKSVEHQVLQLLNDVTYIRLKSRSYTSLFSK